MFFFRFVWFAVHIEGFWLFILWAWRVFLCLFYVSGVRTLACVKFVDFAAVREIDTCIIIEYSYLLRKKTVTRAT